MIRDEVLKTFENGQNTHIQDYFGVHRINKNDRFCYVFRVWAPNAESVSLIGDFTNWFQKPLLMTKIVGGVWEIETDLAKEGHIYKYLVTRKGGQVVEKIDPVARLFENRPGTGAIIKTDFVKKWNDSLWMGRRRRLGFKNRPVNIYEVHANSWKKDSNGRPFQFKELKESLIPYLIKMNYTHVEFMPLMAHPLDMSWGYQVMGYFAFESTFGSPEDFQEFVDACHLNNIGVIVDWVPGHFIQNDDALTYFDGTPTYEYEDYHRAHNYGWGAMNFDLGKGQVQSFLISSALYWIETFHVDGIRVDAVSNMLYLDYDQGPWTPNAKGGNHNLEGIDFLQKLTRKLKEKKPDVMLIAEEASSDIAITKSVTEGGLGFDYKWNMGWMNDVLNFYEKDPYYRKYHFDLITFSFIYCFNENYLLPFSHDEVVHGKKSLMHKMWGDRYNQFAGLRNLYAYQICHPGKKLIFMGSEFGQFLEWKYDDQLVWDNLNDSLNAKMQDFTSKLNWFYKKYNMLWQNDHSYDGLEIIDADNKDESVISFCRKNDKGDLLLCVFNMTPVERKNFTIGVPIAGVYEEVLNTEMEEFGGVWKDHNPNTQTQVQEWRNYKNTLAFTLPALGASVWRIKRRHNKLK